MSEGFQDPIPCPAGKCDAQIYNVKKENLIYCLKCGARNPNFHSKNEVSKIAGVRAARVKRQPLFDPETGVMKW